MNSRPLLRILIVTSLVLSRQGALAHDLPLGLEHPAPPPTIDPGPDAALIRVRIIDSTSKETISATVSVNQGNQEPEDDRYRPFSLRLSGNRHKGPIRSRNVPFYFFTDGRFEVRVPPGPVAIQVRKGYEYRPVEVTLTAGRKEAVDAEIVLERAIDMAALGWYSGDTHIHMERTGANDETLLTVTSAKDIRYAYLLSYNTRGYDLGGPKYESSRQHNGLGDRTLAGRGPYHITSGQEYRANGLGHVLLALPDRYVPANGEADDTAKGPSMAVVADQTHALNGFIGLAHGGYENQEADRLLLEGKMDYLELLQFGTYRSLGLAGWYDFLNIGYRLPMAGASDYPPTRELASEMTYVWSETVPTPRTFLQALAAGRSFGTSGPMLFLTVEGQKPGAILRYPLPNDAKLVVDVRVHSPQYPVRYLDIVVNGAVVERLFDEAGRTDWSLRHIMAIRTSAWIAARAYNDAGTDAHTNPVYVYVGGARPFSAASARQIIARLDGSIAASRIPEVGARLETLKQEVRNLIGTRQTTLPLPSVAP